MNKIFKKILGIILIITGIAGLFLPILQGMLMIVCGLYLLGNKKVIAWVDKRFGKYLKKIKNKKKNETNL